MTGRLADADRPGAADAFDCCTYQLSGTITDVDGKPVQGAVVITRTQDRDFWTHSSASDANGHYTSFYSASDETSADPVPLSVGVASGGVSYGGTLGVNASFKRLASAVLNIKLGPGTSYTLAPPNAYAGAVYSGLVVGVTAGGHVVKPLAERWPTKNGSFSMTLPPSVRGETLRLLGEPAPVLLALPGDGRAAPVDLASWPTRARRDCATRSRVDPALAARRLTSRSTAGGEPAAADRDPPTDKRTYETVNAPFMIVACGSHT